MYEQVISSRMSKQQEEVNGNGSQQQQQQQQQLNDGNIFAPQSSKTMAQQVNHNNNEDDIRNMGENQNIGIPCPTLNDVGPDNPYALEKKIQELNAYMEKIGIPLQHQPPTFRKAYNKYDSDLEICQAGCKTILNDTVGRSGFQQTDADSISSTLEDPTIPAEKKRGYYIYVASSFKKHEEMKKRQREREDEIEQFKAEEYWTIEADTAVKKQNFSAKLIDRSYFCKS